MEEKVKINHELVPEHIKISEDEKKLVLQKFHVVEKQLPSILSSDAALVGLEAQPGDVIKIMRKSPTKGASEYYRVVIHG